MPTKQHPMWKMENLLIYTLQSHMSLASQKNLSNFLRTFLSSN